MPLLYVVGLQKDREEEARYGALAVSGFGARGGMGGRGGYGYGGGGGGFGGGGAPPPHACKQLAISGVRTLLSRR